MLRNFIRDHNPNIILVQETKISKEKVEKLKFFNQGGVCGISSNGAFGGVAIFWNKKTIDGDLIDEDGNIISMRVKCIAEGQEWVVTKIFAPNSKAARSMFWDKIQQKIGFFSKDSWLLMGDFNTPLQEIDKFGGTQAQLDRKIDLMDFINVNALIDVDLSEASYTWSNRSDGGDLIQVRLDRSLITPNWVLKYRCSLSVINRIGSDHYPISFVVDSIKGKHCFPF